MAISDAQFKAWLRTDAARTVLVEQSFGYEAAGAPAVGTIYLSDRGYNTSPMDSPPSVRYRSTIKELPKLKRSIDRRRLGGRAEISVSDLRLVNVDGALDYLLDVVLDGYECRVYLGAPEGTPGWTRADFRLAFVAVAFTLTIGMLNFLNFTIPALFMVAITASSTDLPRSRSSRKRFTISNA
mgnify:CR=1 FL=1